MYEIKSTKSFRKSIKRVVRSGKYKGIEEEVGGVLDTIAKGRNLPRKYEDHALTGEYKTYRECHLRPNLLLIYKIKDGVVYNVNIGSHPELFS